MFEITERKIKQGDQEIVLEFGRFARQASGACLVTSGGTQVLVAVVAAAEAKEGQSFFPLSVDYIEKFYSAGRIPGGYIKRETRPSDREVLTSRLIDRPLRPLFPETYMVETQIVATVVSADPKVPPQALALLGASAALHVSDIPFAGPAAGVHLVRKNGTFLINPPESELETSELDLFVAGTKNAILMVESGAKFVSEELILEGLELAQKLISTSCLEQEEIRKKIGKPKRAVPEAHKNDAMQKALDKKFGEPLKKAYQIPKKSERKLAISEIESKAKETLVPEGDSEASKQFAWLFETLCYKTMRTNILKGNQRIDGRTTTDIRPIVCQTKVLKRTHGSSLFTRGETQSLGVVTLGTSDDVQRSESINHVLEEKNFFLHYTMPGYSVGEPKRLGSPGRREVGHGNLAEKALRASLPPKIRFPYTVRLVSEITESNGSSSMASVCSGTLALLDAGVPLLEPVAGIAMGLIYQSDLEWAVLSDILGDEDNLGDMDFKVAGSKHGISALQMDIKIAGVTIPILAKALEQAKQGRLHILKCMTDVLGKANDLSEHAPRIEQIKIRPDRIKDLIGPGGKNIKRITADSGCKIDITDEGVVNLASTSGEAASLAKRLIQYVTSDPEIGEVYLGICKKVSDFGCFVEIKPGLEGLVHISQLAVNKVNKVEDVVNEGDEVLVKVTEIDRTGRIKLSRKDAIGVQPAEAIKAWVN
jgi:polyribonucleotide nucleotidyltransferase